MEALQLTLANGESSLSVRSFQVVESLSEPFQIEIVARAPSADIDFEGLIGESATFTMLGELTSLPATPRRWTGICIRCEQVRVEPDGLSTYELTIVPQLWLLTKRRNHRLFQHVSVVEITKSLMDEWKVEHQLKVNRANHPPLELRMQYGESDYDFLCRLLEEAGISFYFVQDAERGSVLVFDDEPHGAEPRLATLPFVDAPGQAQAAASEYCTAVRLRRELRPAKVVLRDFDFRRPRYELFADASVPAGVEERLEQYHYVPGAFVTEGHMQTDTPTADDLGVARADQAAGVGLAKRILQGERARRRIVSLRTNAYDLSPGTTLMISGHPRAELSATEKLLMTGFVISGAVGVDEAWVAEGRAVFTDHDYRPALQIAKPRITGVQSAYVVGPEDETVYTDEFGRVRVQFHWDRGGNFDPNSSCWMRVSQAWAGPGYGLFNLPRVGHEVLVGFVEGDPDQPVVVGRVFNGAQQVPYPQPGSKMMSGWKSDSNSNIILFDDTAGDEVFYTQAERNKLNIVKRNEATIIGGRRTEYVRTADKTMVGTSATRVACASHNQLAGISNKFTSTINHKVESGFGVNLKAGRKFQACVTPVVPFLRALMSVNDAKLQIYSKLPGGKAPDLKKLLPAYAGGAKPAQPDMEPAPKMTEEETKEALKKTLAVVGKAITQFEPEEVEEMAEAEDLDHAVDTMLSTLHKKGGPNAVAAFADAQGLTKHLQMLSQANAQQSLQKGATQSQQSQQKQSGLFEQLMLAIVELILPKTKITIKHQKIKIETEKASIELDKENIKLTAKGDIEIKADGSVKIEGQSVSVSPSPCSCG